MVRFKTDANAIHVHYKLTKANLAMPHMPATGASGVDLYARDTDGKWKMGSVTKPANQEVKAEIIKGILPGTREYAAYLPLYNELSFFELVFRRGANFKGLHLVRSRSCSTEQASLTVPVQVAQEWFIPQFSGVDSICPSSILDFRGTVVWMQQLAISDPSRCCCIRDRLPTEYGTWR